MAKELKNQPPGGEAAAFIADAQALPSTGTPKETPVNFLDYVVDFTKEAPKPDYLLEIDGVGVMPAGGVTTVTGRAKQGKTQFLAAVVSCLLSGRDFGRMHRVKAPGRILWVDTEQSNFDIHNTIGRVYNQAGIPAREPSDRHGLTVLQLRPLDAAQRHEAIRAAVEALNPEILIIDGVRDLIHNINDETESAAVVDWVLQTMTARPEMRVIVVLHTNPSGTGDKMRGHLGTEFENKFSDKFLCSKENGVFSVTHVSRGREVLTPFIFCIDGHGQLSTSTIEQRAGVVAADETLAAIVPPEGMEFAEIVKAYAKKTGLTQTKARDALKARINANPPTLIKRNGLFVHVPPGGTTFDKPTSGKLLSSSEVVARIKSDPDTPGKRGAAEKLPFENSEGDNCPF